MKRHLSVQSYIANKKHQCSVCGEEIEPGTEYIRVTALDEDEKIHVYKIHRRKHD